MYWRVSFQTIQIDPFESTHIYHPKQSAKLGSNIFRDYRQKFAEKRQEKQWRLPKTNKLRESLVEVNKLLNSFSISSMVTCMDEKLILLSDGTLVAMTLNAGCDPEWIKLGCQVCHIKI